jgi:hypothetical protein
MAQHIYDPKVHTQRVIQRLTQKGDEFLCPRCKSILDAVGVGVGNVYIILTCPKNPAHEDTRVSLVGDREFIANLADEVDGQAS